LLIELPYDAQYDGLWRRVSELEPASQQFGFALDEASDSFPLSKRPRTCGWRIDWLTLGPGSELDMPSTDVIDIPQLASAHAYGAFGFDGRSQSFESDCSWGLQLRILECEQPLVDLVLGFTAGAERCRGVVRKRPGLRMAAGAQGGGNFPNRKLLVRVAPCRL
jgi:hypothetical protein